jgi:hypothetical protein
MNKSPGGVDKGKIKAYRRDIYFLLKYIIPELRGTKQVLWQLNINREKEPKDIEQILKEYSYNIPSLRFKCVKNAKCTKLLEYPSPIEKRYCLAHILLNHQDFYKEKSQIKELITKHRYKAIFLPKFHYKINLIKMY